MSKTKLANGWMVAMAILSCDLSLAADINFTGVSGSHWVTPSNWQNGSYPATGDTAFLDATASLDTPSPNDLQAIKVGTQGTGILHVTFDGSLAAEAVNSVSQIGSGSNHQGSIEQTNGAISVNALEIGSNSATGTYNLNRGTLNVARRSQNNSIYLGTNAAKTSDGLGTLTITAGSVTTRGGVYLGSTSGGIGIFEVHGSDSAQIGIGSTNNIDGSWTQNAGSILRVKIDRTAKGVTPVFIDDAENDGSGGDVIFESGALLDVDFLANYVNGGTFTVMEWEGNLTNHGLQFAPSVDTNIWSFNLDTANKKLTVTAAGSPYVRHFAHPGGRHKLSDLERMRDMVAAGVEPWSSSFADLNGSGRGRFTYTVATAGAPLTELNGSTYNNFRNDCMAAYHNSLMWFITQDNRHADKTIEILNTWSGLTKVTGITPLDLGRSIVHLVDAAEIIRHTYTGWNAADIQQFSDMLVYPGYSNTTIPTGDVTFYWGMYNGDPARAGNQGFFAMRALLTMGVFLENERMYDRVLRYVRGATHRADDLPYPTGPPINGDPTDIHEYAIQWGQSGRETTIADYGYNEVMANYIWENGQNEESSRDQGHVFTGLINITTLCETAWNQGDDLYGHLNNRALTGWEFSLRYNVSYQNFYPDQPSPWEPTLESGEYLQRLVRTGRRFSLKINPRIDGDPTAWTRGNAISEPMYEVTLGHYRDRMGINGEKIKWLERGHTLLESTQGFEGEADGFYGMSNWGGLKYRRVSPGDPVQGFSNGSPDFAMNSLPMTIEAENYDYFPIDGEGRTYHDLSATNSGLSYRPAEGVDLSSASEGGFAVSSIEAGEWITYTVSVPASSSYNLSLRYASTAPGGTIRFSVDGTDITGDVPIPHGAPASSGASDWQDLNIATAVPLTQGVKQLTITFGGASGAFLLNNFTIVETPVDPIAHWRFDEGTGTTANDCSGNGHHGTITNATWTTRSGGGSALSFNGTNARVSLPASAFASLSDKVSFAFWALGSSSLPTQNSAFWAGSGGTRILNVHLPWNDTKVYFDAPNRISKTATEAETEGAWVHWAFTKDATTGSMRIYRNGSLWHSGTGGTSLIGSITQAFIGGQNSGNYYPGLIDDFRLYNVALSPTAISTLYSNALNPQLLTYTAGSGGSISGISPQTIAWSSNGCPVTAVPDANYTFVNWSDGRTDNPRTDLKVTGDLTVTANFAAIHTALESWRFTHFGTHDNSGVAADDFDADLDGLFNLLEYATGTDPNIPNGPPLSIGPGMELSFDRIADPSLNYLIEGTDDLAAPTWAPVWSGTGSSAGTVTVPEAAWPSGHDFYFFRLGVSY